MSQYRISLDLKMHYDVEKENIEEAEKIAEESAIEFGENDDIDVCGYEVEEVAEGDTGE